MHRCAGSSSRLPVVLHWLTVLLLAAVVGCGGRPTTEIEDPEEFAISDLVGNISGYSTNPEMFQTLFAQGALPNDSQRAKYVTYMYGVEEGGISITGDTATIKVEAQESATDERLDRTLDWTAVKEGGMWKLKTAPPP